MDAAVSNAVEIETVIHRLTGGRAVARRRVEHLDQILTNSVSPVRISALMETSGALAAARAELALARTQANDAVERRRRRLGWALRWPAIETRLARIFYPESPELQAAVTTAEERLAIVDAQAARAARRQIRLEIISEQERERARLSYIERWFSDLLPRLRGIQGRGRSHLTLAGAIDLRSSVWVRQLDQHLAAVEKLEAQGGAPVSPINDGRDVVRDLSPRAEAIPMLRPEIGDAPWLQLLPDDRMTLAASARPEGGLGGFMLRGRSPRPRPSHLYMPRERQGVPKLAGTFNGQTRVYLPVPFERAEEVVAAGGAVGKRGGLYADPRQVDFGGPIMRYLPFVAQRYYLPLQTDLIPKTSWGASLANLLSQTSWDRIRLQVTARYGGLCQICGQLPGKQAIECHEIWDYEPNRRAHGGMRVQRLVGLMSVCRSCHGVFHLGFSERLGRGDQAQYRLADINGWSMAEEEEAIDWMVETYETRSREWWALDLSLVADAGLIVDASKWRVTPEGGLLRKKAGVNETPTRILGASWRLGGKGELRGIDQAAAA